MLVARLLYPVHALGPGNRIAIWMCGCKKRCPMCANPELQAFDPERDITPAALVEIITSLAASHDVTGLTITGGEPFEQTEELYHFLRNVRHLFSDIMAFSGYTLFELESRNDIHTKQILDLLDVLVDGEYIDEQNNGSALRGSDNQTIHIFNERLTAIYDKYISSGRLFENFESPEGIISVGLHYQGFIQEFHERLSQRL